MERGENVVGEVVARRVSAPLYRDSLLTPKSESSTLAAEAKEVW